MYVNSLVCIRVKGSEIKCFRIGSGVRQGGIMSTWLFNVYMDAVVKEVKMGEWRLHGILNAGDLVLCGELEEDMMMMEGHFVEVCKSIQIRVR